MRYLKILHLFGGLAVVSLFTSCYSDSYGYAPAAKRGAVAGGLIGAGLGTVIGSQSDRPLEGAAIGGAIGALGGAALGSARDDLSRYPQKALYRPSYRSSSRYDISIRYGHYTGRRPYSYNRYSGSRHHRHSHYDYRSPAPSCYLPSYY